MTLRRLPWIFIERCNAQDEEFTSAAMSDHLAAAVAAEKALLSWRRLERLKNLLALEPLEVLALDGCRGVEGGSVRFSTGAARAMTNGRSKLRHVVFDLAAKTTTAHGTTPFWMGD